MAQSMQIASPGAYILQSLGMALFALGDPSAALACLDEGLTLVQKNNNHLIEGLLLMQQAQVLLSQGKTQRALAKLHASGQLLSDEPPLYTADRLAYAALANRLAGDRAQAQQLAARAMRLIQPDDFGNPDWAVADTYWACYRAVAPEQAGRPAAALPDELWQILDLGRQALFAPVEQFSDAGLRRSYLHRGWCHRLLIYEWLTWAPLQAAPVAVADFTSQVQRPGRLRDSFRRLADVGIRLNTERNPSRLFAQIVDEVAELTGAERIALVILDDAGQRRTVKVLLPVPPPPFIGATDGAVPDPELFLAEVQPQLAEAVDRQQGFVRQLNGDGALAEQRSVLVVPLLNRGHLVGLIYCDLAGCFGRFALDDLELLRVLANQSAVAVENADWYAMLEQKVAQRTAELARLTSALRDANADLEQRVAARMREPSR